MPLSCSSSFLHTHPPVCAVAYGLEKLNAEVAAWMRADKTPEGGRAAPPFLAMGWVLSCAVHLYSNVAA